MKIVIPFEIQLHIELVEVSKPIIEAEKKNDQIIMESMSEEWLHNELVRLSEPIIRRERLNKFVENVVDWDELLTQELASLGGEEWKNRHSN